MALKSFSWKSQEAGGSAGQAIWPADRVERWPIKRLVPYARNARTHSDAQVAQIAASIREWGWTNPVLVDEDGTIIAGHGRRAGGTTSWASIKVPVMVAAGWTEAQKRAYAIADNKLDAQRRLGRGTARPRDRRAGELGFDLDLIGFSERELAALARSALPTG